MRTSSSTDHFDYKISASSRGVPFYSASMDAELEPLANLHHLTSAPFLRLNPRYSFGGWLLKAVAKVLRDPLSVHTNATSGPSSFHPCSNVAVAFASPDGVVAPVVPRADLLGVNSLGQQLQGLAARAAKGALRDRELLPTTLVVSTLPGVADDPVRLSRHLHGNYNLLSFGTAKSQPRREGKVLVYTQIMPITLHCDNRVTERSAAVEFLDRLCLRLEDPVGLLV